MKAKCINSSGSGGMLQKDKVYEVKDNGSTFIVPLSGSWKKSRFILIDDKQTADTLPAMKAAKKINIDTEVDLEEERMWAMLKPRVEPGNCPCGISRKVCQYHPA